MPHLHTEPGQHDHTVSAYIVRMDASEPRLLLHRHKKMGVYMQFGGHIELDETPWQAITHELLEESGYELDQLSLLQPPIARLTSLTHSVAHPYPVSHNTHPVGSLDDHFHTDSVYAFTTVEEPRQPRGDKESSDVRVLNRQELAELPPAEIFENVRELGQFVLDVCLSGWEPIPATSIGPGQ